jgi:uncharacterized membrane protein
MNLQDLITNTDVLELVKWVLFVGFFTFATSYLLPRGVMAWTEWKETKAQKKLVSAITYCSAGVFVFLYLLTTSIISHAKIFWE